jgi:hypothetical protein
MIKESTNVITNRGRIAIGRYLTGERQSWSDSMVIGSGNPDADPEDESLAMEFWREEIDMKEYSAPTGEITLRSIIPSRISGKISEIGVYCTISSLRQVSSSPIAIFFDNSVESWTLTSNTTFDTTNYRIGKSAVLFSPATGNNAIASIRFPGSFNSYNEDTKFRLSYQILSGTINSITLRLKSSESTYREYFFDTLGSDYSVKVWETQDFILEGNADWEDFNSLEVIVDGNGQVVLDGFAVSYEPSSIETVLVSITNLAALVEKNESQEIQIEYVLDLGIN